MSTIVDASDFCQPSLTPVEAAGPANCASTPYQLRTRNRRSGLVEWSPSRRGSCSLSDGQPPPDDRDIDQSIAGICAQAGGVPSCMWDVADGARVGNQPVRRWARLLDYLQASLVGADRPRPRR